MNAAFDNVSMLKQAMKAVLPASLQAEIRKFLQRRRLAAAQEQVARDKRERMASRRQIVDRYYVPKLKLVEEWIVRDTETANFYYDLTDLNKQQLAHFVSVVANTDVDQASGFIRELLEDASLLAFLQADISTQYPQTDILVAYGRRLGWYAAVRALKPKILVETGVDHGVGACVLCAALLRNQAEGAPGRYYGLDIQPSAGRLLTGPYAAVGEMVYGDSIESLKHFPHRIVLFVNDSDHSEDFEAREYEALAPLLAPGATVLSDNSHSTDVLGRFARARGMNFLFFREQPKDHWYFGAGIGAAFPSSRATLPA